MPHMTVRSEPAIGAGNDTVHSGRRAARLLNQKNAWAHFFQSTRHPAGRTSELTFWARGGESVNG